MNDELTVLAEAGATALVTAMATDLWQETRNTIVGLFRRSGRGRRAALATQLDTGAALVRDAADPDEVRRTLFAYWTLELVALLRDDPAVRDAVTRLAAASGTGRELSFRQTITARDSAAVFVVQHGTQHAYGPGTTGDRGRPDDTPPVA
ncbi:hypothetical protein ACFXKF_09865 [Streptomyces scopuliridis]|uniref:hypothetical protein n=1 Tax=Streptomyces scopuliridis TaxID=452529 RepID=UPI003697D5CA